MKLTALKNRIEKGFTLVELLVVIGILGVLVAALLATLDPLEQIRKGNDSARLSVAREYHQAYSRYYAQYGDFPWAIAASGCTTAPVATGTPLSGYGCNPALVNAGELKSASIPTNINTAPNDLTITASGTSIAVCFRPASKAQKTASNATVTGAACTPTAPAYNSTNCYICVQ